MHLPSNPPLAPGSFLLISILFLNIFFLTSIDIAVCDQDIGGTSSNRTVPCESTYPCSTKLRASFEHEYNKTYDHFGTIQIANGFNQHEACPATELVDSSMDLLLIANQVGAHHMFLRRSYSVTIGWNGPAITAKRHRNRLGWVMSS
jgi:hypothetical protein